MELQKLAALVTVRNHLLNVMNDKSVTNRDEFQPLNQLRIKLDKKFVQFALQIDPEMIDNPLADALGMYTEIEDEPEPANEEADKLEQDALAVIGKLKSNGVTPTVEGAVAIVAEEPKVAKSIVENSPEIKAATTEDPEVAKRIAEEKEKVKHRKQQSVVKRVDASK